MKFGPDEQSTFLAHLRKTGNVTEAADRVGISASTAYHHRQTDPAFGREWQAAIEGCVDDAEAELLRRGMEGVEEPVFYKGDVVGFVTRKSDSNLQFFLKGRRRHVYGDKTQVDLRGALATGEMTNEERAKALAEILRTAQERRDLVE